MHCCLLNNNFFLEYQLRVGALQADFTGLLT